MHQVGLIGIHFIPNLVGRMLCELEVYSRICRRYRQIPFLFSLRNL